MIKISISIVLYKPDFSTLEKVLHCLNVSVQKAQQDFDAKFVLYLIDNASGDPFVEKLHSMLEKYAKLHFIDYKIIESKKNLGYGGGHNLAIKEIQSKYHLVLNPDVFVQDETLLNAIDYMEKNEKVGLLTPAVFGEDGGRHFLCKQNPSLFNAYLRAFAPSCIKKLFSSKMKKFEMHGNSYEEIMENILFCTGCFMFFRTDMLKQLKGFDESFFMYYEDADISRRLLHIAETVYVPQVTIIHQWTRGAHHNPRLRWFAVKSAFIYWKKWGGVF